MNAKRLGLGCIAGVLSSLLFSQGAIAIMHSLGLPIIAPWSMLQVPPFNLPVTVTGGIYGGIYGTVFAAVVRPTPLINYVRLGVFVGFIVSTILLLFVIRPVAGATISSAFIFPNFFFVLIVNAAWGFGTTLLLYLFADRQRAETPRATEPAPGTLRMTKWE